MKNTSINSCSSLGDFQFKLAFFIRELTFQNYCYLSFGGRALKLKSLMSVANISASLFHRKRSFAGKDLSNTMNMGVENVCGCI